jgi:GNAT superfamily N-acetyltransferase
MEIRPILDSDLGDWINMRGRLWPGHERQELVGATVDWRHGKLGVFVAASAEGLVGFAEVAMRERADGCITSPVGYLEGWWVDPEHRRSGVGTALLGVAEDWSRVRGAAEFASDAHVDNDMSRAAHAACGFAEKRAVLRFHKELATAHAVFPAVERTSTVTLCEINSDNVRAVTRLSVEPHQRAFVAPNAVSLAQYAFTPEAWTRAVYAGETPIGYVLLAHDEGDAYPDYLWRFMIDRRYQGMGFGKAAMNLVVEHVRSPPGATGLATSYVPLAGGPEDFYHRLGFVDTGSDDHGELETFLAF